MLPSSYTMAHLEDLDLQHVKGDDIAPTAMALALATQLLNKRDDAAGYRVASVGVVGDSVFKGLSTTSGPVKHALK